ncbi:MAG: glycosyltransferase [Clostridia bacterium]|nr:glycosyltransferase [Clostridia bacterium]
MKRRIAFINQRYGREVNGGSELYTRVVAEHLKDNFEVEVLTTKALDYMTWKDYYKDDVEDINGITVRRFSVDKPRNQAKFDKINAKMLRNRFHTEADEELWVNEQGPICSGLINYIRDNKDKYDLFIFVTYLFYTTCVGIQGVYDKAIMIPTAHDEPYIHFNYYRKIFENTRGFIFLTDEEKSFVNRLFMNWETPSVTTAMGIDMPKLSEEESKVPAELKGNYIVYAGRIDEGKNCDKMFTQFIRYKERTKNNLKLVLMGKNVIPIPKHEDIIYLGFVSEEEKFDYIIHSLALILPSKFESLSISVLEALQVGTPILVNGECEVLKGHCHKSNAGLYYKGYLEFEGCLNYMVSHNKEMKAFGNNGISYVETNYRWDVVVKKLTDFINERIERC